MNWLARVLSSSLIILGCVAGTGCASVKYNYSPQVTDISEPPIGSVVTAAVGDSMLRQGKYREHDAVRLAEQVKVGVIGNYTFSPGHYLKHGSTSAGDFYRPSSVEGSGSVTAGAITDPFESLLIQNDGTFCGVSVFGGKVCKKGVSFTKITLPILSEDSFQQTLLYSGKAGSKINIGYREFSGNAARPAFNNDVEYDLSESNVIGYKGAQLEIIEATNQFIRYKVISNFNAATQ